MHHPRIPAACPPNFQGRYTVQSGDTMFFIAQRFGVSLNALIAANPHIPNPNKIFPGDVLCVPGHVPPPPPVKDCPCPPTLVEFLGLIVEVTTTCATITGTLLAVGDQYITIGGGKAGQATVICCQEICWIRVFRPHHPYSGEGF